MQHQDLNRIPEIIVIKLIVADAVQAHGCFGNYHEIERRTSWTPFGEGRRQATSSDPHFACESYAYKSTCGVGFKLEERTDLVGTQFVDDLFRLSSLLW